MRRALVWSLVLALGWAIGCKPHIATPKNKEDASPKQVKKAAESFTSETDFQQRVAQEARAEVEFGKLAQSKAQNADVKAYAEQMVKDYAQILNDLQKLAGSQNITLPADLDSSQQELKSKLDSESGKDFDKAYMSADVKRHEEIIRLLQGAIQKTQTPTVRDFATVNLITVRDHLDQARAIAKKIGA